MAQHYRRTEWQTLGSRRWHPDAVTIGRVRPSATGLVMVDVTLADTDGGGTRPVALTHDDALTLIAELEEATR